MKDQKYNEGELRELKLNIDSQVVDAVELMSENTEYTQADIVVIALKRFISHHADYMNEVPKSDLPK
jgi:hypothetical protein